MPAPGHSIGEYLETIYFLAFPIGEYVPHGAGSPPLASRVAEMLHVSRASAGEMLKRLEAEGLISRGEKKEALLTETGRERAERVVRKHRIIERLLTDFMGYTAYESHERADEMGDTFDDDMIERIDEKLGHPQRCPHGWPVDPEVEQTEERRADTARHAVGRHARDGRPTRRARRRPPPLVLRPGSRAGHEHPRSDGGAGGGSVHGHDRECRRARDLREGRCGTFRPAFVIVRAATAADLSFLQVMLYEAATWRPEAQPPPETVHANPHVARYLCDWGRLGDAGLICEGDEPLGAAWFRLFPADEPGYGFVSPDVPELTIGVAPASRGRGVGTRLLEELVELASADGYRALSLSVEPDNTARELYERLGFVRVADDGGAWTMLRELRPS